MRNVLSQRGFSFEIIWLYPLMGCEWSSSRRRLRTQRRRPTLHVMSNSQCDQSTIVHKVREAQVMVFGQSGVGTTSLIQRLVNDTFVEQGTTMGVELESWRVPLSSVDADTSEGAECVVRFFDMGNSANYSCTWAAYAKNADLAILVCDCRHVSLEELIRLSSNMLAAMSRSNLFLVFTKGDLLDENVVPELEKKLEVIYEQLGPLDFQRCLVSSKSGGNFDIFRAQLTNALYLLWRTTEIPKNLTFKIVILGEMGVGKTTFLECAVHGTKIQETCPTIGIDLCAIDIKREECQGAVNTIRLHIWDTAGQERFGAIPARMLNGAHVVIIVQTATSYLKNHSLRSLELELLDGFEGRVEHIFMKTDLVQDDKARSKMKESRNFFSFEQPQKIQQFVHSLGLSLVP